MAACAARVSSQGSAMTASTRIVTDQRRDVLLGLLPVLWTMS